MDSMNLYELIRSIKQKEILLPDFQRGFVWGDEMQRKLASSVLTKIPLGSILLLEADANEYGCKMIGRKTPVDTKGLANVEILLDGQQRITVLTNIFSNVIFDGVENYREELASSDLKRRFFISINKNKLNNKNDIWGLNKLCFDLKEPGMDYPPFLSNDIYETVEMLNFTKKDKMPYNPEYHDDTGLIEFCCAGSMEYYRVPLFLLIDNEENYKFCLSSILGRITDTEVGNRFPKIKNYSDRKEFIRDNFCDEYLKYSCIVKYLESDNELEKQLKVIAGFLWKDRILKYLSSCIENIDLNRISIKKSDRDRAIDIYENLNLGGVTLSTFELVMAKAAKLGNAEENKNLFERICDYIEEGKTYPLEVVPERMQSVYIKYLEAHNNRYSASKQLGCYIQNKNQLRKKYTDAFLDVLCLYCNNIEFRPEGIRLEYIKRQEILKLTADDINKYYLDVCKGLDRACFFLQMNCGIRNINEVNYNLMFALLGYLFINDNFWNDKSLLKKLNAWYWSSIFSGKLDKDQNTTIIYHLENLLKREFDFIVVLKDKMFNGSDFSDKKTVLMETGYPPKSIIKSALCQYYLSLTYKDLCTEQRLSSLTDECSDIQEHHILPLGSDKDIYKNKAFTKKLREDKGCIYNSPINFVYITKESNNNISSKPIGLYKKMCDEVSIQKLHMNVLDADFTSSDKVKTQLEKRYDEVVTEITGRVMDYLE